jgi:hypothetical protein
MGATIRLADISWDNYRSVTDRAAYHKCPNCDKKPSQSVPGVAQLLPKRTEVLPMEQFSNFSDEILRFTLGFSVFKFGHENSTQQISVEFVYLLSIQRASAANTIRVRSSKVKSTVMLG